MTKHRNLLRVVAVSLSACLGVTICAPHAVASPSHADQIISSAEVPATEAEIDQLANELETVFTEYVAKTTDGRWEVTEIGRLSGVDLVDLQAIADMMNREVPTGSIAHHDEGLSLVGNHHILPMSGYAQCVLNGVGLGWLTRAGRAGIVAALERRAWRLAAREIIRVVGRAALRSGGINLAVSLAWYGVRCIGR